MASEGALDEVMLDFVEAHVFEARSGAGSGRAQAEIGGADRRAGGGKDAALDGVIQLTDMAGPGMIGGELRGDGIETGVGLGIGLAIAPEKMGLEQVEIF